MTQQLKGKEFWSYRDSASVLIALTPDDKILVQTRRNKQHFITKFEFLNFYTRVTEAIIVNDTIPSNMRIISYKEFQELIPNLVKTIYVIFNINKKEFL